MTVKLKKFLIELYGDGGNLRSEFHEYGVDAKDAVRRAIEKYGGRPANYIVVGEIS